MIGENIYLFFLSLLLPCYTDVNVLSVVQASVIIRSLIQATLAKMQFHIFQAEKKNE